MKIPASIRVSCHYITIETMDVSTSSGERLYGDFSESMGNYKIRVAVDGIPDTVIADTLIHEVQHVIVRLYNMQFPIEEEDFVVLNATAWTQVWMDNPDLLKYIQFLLK